VPILPVDLFGAEIVGYESLKTLAERIYGAIDPLERFVAEEPYRLIKKDGRYCLRLKLPFLVKAHIDLSKISDELILRIGSYKRHILLPRQVASRTTVKAKIEEPYLNITFSGGTHEQGEALERVCRLPGRQLFQEHGCALRQRVGRRRAPAALAARIAEGYPGLGGWADRAHRAARFLRATEKGHQDQGGVMRPPAPSTSMSRLICLPLGTARSAIHPGCFGLAGSVSDWG
jgi:HSP20 family molecular chaperone IbpA